MPFETIEPPPPRKPQITPKMSARELKGGAIKVALTVPDEIAERAGWSEGQGFTVAFGTGKDKGWLLLKPGKPEEAPFIPHALRPRGKGTSASLSFNLGEPPFAPGQACESTPCDYKVFEIGLAVKLPDWCFTDFDETEAE